jgi:ubiquinone/menaquinone biosynthesis C-methylase UbiE
MTAALSARYDRAAPRWGPMMARLGFTAAYRELAAEALRRFPLAGPAHGTVSVADLGTGDGAFAEALQAAAGRGGAAVRVTLLDSAPGMLEAARRRLNPEGVRFVLGDLDRAALPGAPFDLIGAAHVLEHVPDLRATLGRIRALLKPGGVLVLAVSRPHWCSRLVWLNWRHRMPAPGMVRAALAAAGFLDPQDWRLAAGPPRRLSQAYAARRPEGWL